MTERWTNANAAEVTLAALEGRIRPEHDALVQLVRTMAAGIDANPGNAAYAKEYREALRVLLEVAEPNDDDGGDDLIAALRSPMGDASES